MLLFCSLLLFSRYYVNVDGNLTASSADLAPGAGHRATVAARGTGAGTGRVLGGEVSMWTNHYCHAGECQPAPPGAERPCAWWMSGAAGDAEFAASVTATVWPKAAVAGGAFWRYDGAMTEPELAQPMAAHAERLAARGVAVCPFLSTANTACRAVGCHESAHCGVPYGPAPPAPPDVKVDATCRFS